MKRERNAYQQAKWNAGRAVLSAALSAAGGIVAKAAKDIGVGRTCMYQLVRKYGLESECKPMHGKGNGEWNSLPAKGSVFLRTRRKGVHV